MLARNYFASFSVGARENHLRGLARESGFSLSTIQHEVKRLRAIGLVSSRTDGFHCFFQANESHPLTPVLRQLVRIGSTDRAFTNQRKRPRRRQRGRRRDPLQRANFLTSFGIVRRPV